MNMRFTEYSPSYDTVEVKTDHGVVYVPTKSKPVMWNRFMSGKSIPQTIQMRKIKTKDGDVYVPIL